MTSLKHEMVKMISPKNERANYKPTR